MANAALSLSPPPTRVSPASDVAAMSLTADRLCAGCGIFALAWAVGSLWPQLGLPAWPAASVGLIALALALGPGRVLLKATGTICGFMGLTGAVLEIVALWSLSWVGG